MGKSPPTSEETTGTILAAVVVVAAGAVVGILSWLNGALRVSATVVVVVVTGSVPRRAVRSPGTPVTGSTPAAVVVVGTGSAVVGDPRTGERPSAGEVVVGSGFSRVVRRPVAAVRGSGICAAVVVGSGRSVVRVSTAGRVPCAVVVCWVGRASGVVVVGSGLSRVVNRPVTTGTMPSVVVSASVVGRTAGVVETRVGRVRSLRGAVVVPAVG